MDCYLISPVCNLIIKTHQNECDGVKTGRAFVCFRTSDINASAVSLEEYCSDSWKMEFSSQPPTRNKVRHEHLQMLDETKRAKIVHKAKTFKPSNVVDLLRIFSIYSFIKRVSVRKVSVSFQYYMIGSKSLKFRKRQAPNIPGRLNWSCRGVESILEQSGNVQVTAAALQYLVLCHERFLERLGSELQLPEDCLIAKAVHVEQALEEMGLHHVIEQATKAVDTKPPAEKRKKKGSKNFTAEDRAQQEQLLAASRERALESAINKT